MLASSIVATSDTLPERSAPASLSPPPVIFHGYSVLIQPPLSGGLPKDAHVWAANFFSYAATAGYLSFGWWVVNSLVGQRGHDNGVDC